MGKSILVSDKIPTSKIFCLQTGAIRLTESQVPNFVSEPPRVGQANFQVKYQGEGAFNTELMGYAYDPAAGANPNTATLGTAASWVKKAADNKNTAGSIITLI